MWNGSIYDLDYWAIPKAAEQGAGRAVHRIHADAEAAAGLRTAHRVRPTNIAAIKSLDAKTLANLPNSPANGKNAVLEDIGFWTDHSDELEQRFAAWATK